MKLLYTLTGPLPFWGIGITPASKQTSKHLLLILISSRPLHAIQLEEARRARISLPVEVVLGVAAAFQVEAALLARGAVRERDMVVGDILEEMDFFFLEEEACGDGVHGGVTPPLIEEAAVFVELLKVVEVGWRA